MNPADPEEERIRRNIQRTVGQRALKELRTIVDEEQRERAAYARVLKYVIIAMLVLLLALAYLLGVL